MQNSRIKLVPPSMDYAHLMLEAIIESENELRQFLPWVDYALTKPESIANTQEAIDNFNHFTGELRYSIIRKLDGKFLGAVGLIIRDKSVPFFEIGYWMRTSETGKGYITEAIPLLENFAFKKCNAKRIEVNVAIGNFPSQSVAIRCGYQLEATLKNSRRLPSGELSDTLIYSKICK